MVTPGRKKFAGSSPTPPVAARKSFEGEVPQEPEAPLTFTFTVTFTFTFNHSLA